MKFSRICSENIYSVYFLLNLAWLQIFAEITIPGLIPLSRPSTLSILRNLSNSSPAQPDGSKSFRVPSSVLRGSNAVGHFEKRSEMGVPWESNVADLMSKISGLRSEVVNEHALKTVNLIEENYKKLPLKKTEQSGNIFPQIKDRVIPPINAGINTKEVNIRSRLENLNSPKDKLLTKLKKEESKMMKQNNVTLSRNVQESGNSHLNKGTPLASHNSSLQTLPRYPKAGTSSLDSLVYIFDPTNYDLRFSGEPHVQNPTHNSISFGTSKQVTNIKTESHSPPAILNEMNSPSVLDLLPDTATVQTSEQNSPQIHPLQSQGYEGGSSYSPTSGPTQDTLENSSNMNLSTPTTTLLDVVLKNEEAIRSALKKYIPSPQTDWNSVPQGEPSSLSNYNVLLNAITKLNQLQVSNPPDIRFADTVIPQDVNNPANAVPSAASQSTNNVLAADTNANTTPEELTDLLNSLRPLTGLQQTNFAIPDTRTTPELIAAVTALITDISTALTTFLTSLQMAIAANPLLGGLLALLGLALLWHLFSHFKHKKGGYGHGGHKGGGGGYHRRNWTSEYRHFKENNQELTISILTKLKNFEHWLDSIDKPNQDAFSYQQLIKS